VTGGRVLKEKDVFMDQDNIKGQRKMNVGSYFMNGQLLTIEPKY
jgi:hypothetical protein